MQNYKKQKFKKSCKDCEMSKYICGFGKTNFICAEDRTHEPDQQKDGVSYMLRLYRYIEARKVDLDGICDLYKKKI